MTSAELSRISGLVFPEDMSDFRSVALEDDLQFDVSFDMPSGSTAEFVEKSGLPGPEADRRVLIHASPLWDLNPSEGWTIRSAHDTFGDVDRAVELISRDTTTSTVDGDVDTTTVHISLTPAHR